MKIKLTKKIAITFAIVILFVSGGSAFGKVGYQKYKTYVAETKELRQLKEKEASKQEELVSKPEDKEREEVKQLYIANLSREPSEEEIDNWIEKGVSISEIELAIRGSEEYKIKNKESKNILTNNNTANNTAKKIELPSFASQESEQEPSSGNIDNATKIKNADQKLSQSITTAQELLDIYYKEKTNLSALSTFVQNTSSQYLGDVSVQQYGAKLIGATNTSISIADKIIGITNDIISELSSLKGSGDTTSTHLSSLESSLTNYSNQYQTAKSDIGSYSDKFAEATARSDVEKEKAELQQTVQSQEKLLQTMNQIASVVDQIDSELSSLDSQITAKENEIEGIKNKPIAMSFIEAQLVQPYAELDYLYNQWNGLIAVRQQFQSIASKLSNGSVLSSSDETLLNSFSINY